MFKVNVFVGTALIDTRIFDNEDDCIDFASDEQDNGRKVRVSTLQQFEIAHVVGEMAVAY